MVESGDNADTWQEWSNHVLAELKRLHTTLEALDEKIDKVKDALDDKVNKIKDEQISELKVEIAQLKIKSSLWGAAGGAIPVLILLVIEILKTKV